MLEKKNTFHFKQFSIRHEHAAMKVGTDGVLLGAWVNPEKVSRVLDIGTGTGLIALMLAQRTSHQTKIEAIEIEEQAYKEACSNVEHSPWKNRIQVFNQSLQDFSSEPFDLIVCNPPFFYNSMKPPDSKRMLARHADSMPMDRLAMHSKQLLHPTGTVSIIIPFVDQMKIKSVFQEHGLYCAHATQIRTKKNKQPERILLSFTNHVGNLTTDELILLEENGIRTKEYNTLTQEFYLKL